MKLMKLFLDFLFPPRCIGCSEEKTWLCKDCFSATIPSFHPVFQDFIFLEKLFAFSFYGNNPLLQKAIHTMKYLKHPEDIIPRYGQALANILISEVSLRAPQQVRGKAIPNEIAFVPVPLHPRRKKERGFNQAELLAREIQKHLPGSFLETELLIRSEERLSQVKASNRRSRFENLKDVFKVQKKVNPENLYVLVDDVSTTGATLESCAQVLKKNGAKKVFGLVMAKD